MKVDPDEENIKNYISPNMTNEYFSIEGIIHCLRHGFMRMSKLPPGISERVHDELDRIKNKPTLTRQQSSGLDV